MKKFLLINFLTFVLISVGLAQGRTVSGTVTSSEDGYSLPGVNVLIPGTTSGTTTDFEGKYQLEIPEGVNNLIFSSIGYVTEQIDVGTRSVVNVQMNPDIQHLTEVVVTAMNVTREKASLGYSQQSVDGEQISRVPESNMINSLSGKVSGVQVRTNNTMGGSTNITIRGNSSFSNNQPLFVIDGVPVSNQTNNQVAQENGRSGYDYGNPAADINPQDIESMSVLKGAAATALYGSRGQNGVILITTKKGVKRKGIGVNISSGITVGKIDKSTFINYQDQYGAGYGPYYGSDGHGYFEEADVDNDGVLDRIVPTTEDGSYGGRFDPNLQVYHWDSFVPESPNFGMRRPWVAAANTPVDFFETQTLLTNSVALSGGNESTTFRLSYSNVNQSDIMPNSKMVKHAINFTAATELSSKLSSDVMFQLSRQDVVGRFSTGYGDNLMSQFRQWWQTNVDIKAQEDIYNSTGRNYTWNGADFTDPLTPIYWDNPYWTRYQNYNSDNRDRALAKIGVNYKFTDWLTLTGRVSIDGFREVREERRAVGSVPTEFGVPRPDGSRADEGSGYQRINIESTEYNYDAMLTVNKDLSEDFSLFSILGFNLRKERYDYSHSATSGGLAVPGLYSLNNSVNPNPFPFEYLWEKEVYGYFANANLGFRDFLYLDGNYRVDVSSALPVENNTYPYWSVGLGLVFSEIVDLNWLNFGKFRASYGTVGNDTRPLRVFDVYTRADNFGSAIMTTLPSTKNNQDLKPEQTEEIEFGLQLTALDRRLNFDISVYNRETVNQLIGVDVSPATGYSFKFINAGDIRNRGIELILGGDIVRTNNLTFNTSVNFTLNRSEVLSLIGDTENYVFASYQGGITANATVGQPFGVFRGTGFEYLNGEKVVTATGYYKAVPDQVIGDPNPDWLMGINNTLSYKGIALSFLIDIQKGGDVFSLDTYYGMGTGVPDNTVGLNDKGNPIRNTLDEGGGVLLPGVTEGGEPNTTYARADYYGGVFYWGNNVRNPAQSHIYDASYVKLRELSLTYSLPQSLINSFSNNVNLSLVGRNLWIIHKNVPFADPESGLGAGPAQGYLTGSYPTVRQLGFKVDIGF